MMPTTRAVYACVKGLTAGVTGARGYVLVAGVTVALFGVAVWPASWHLGVTRAAEPSGAESPAPLVAQGAKLFAMDFTPERGLGPLFNADFRGAQFYNNLR